MKSDYVLVDTDNTLYMRVRITVWYNHGSQMCKCVYEYVCMLHEKKTITKRHYIFLLLFSLYIVLQRNCSLNDTNGDQIRV